MYIHVHDVEVVSLLFLICQVLFYVLRISEFKYAYFKKLNEIYEEAYLFSLLNLI